MTWNCEKCCKAISDDFDACWACGTSQDGIIDPGFQHSDAYEPTVPDEKDQFSLADLIKIMTVLCLAFAILSVLGRDSKSHVLTIVLAWGGSVYVLFHLFRWIITLTIWLITFPMLCWQRRLRAERGDAEEEGT